MKPRIVCPLFYLVLQVTLGGRAAGFCEFPPAGDFRTRWRCKGALGMSFFNPFGDKRQSKVDEDEILLLEKEVLSNAQAQIDAKNAKRAIEVVISDSSEQIKTTPQWAAAIAASVAAGSVAFFTVQSLPLGVIVALSVGFLASRDPVKEDDPAGAIARTVGRYTLASVEAATPKAKAMARAALTGEEEIDGLKEQVETLREENIQLKLWKTRRIWVDKVLSSYNLQDLKEQARTNGLRVGGTKTHILMRLVEAEVITPDLENTKI